VRTTATARILMPRSMVRLAAGRMQMTRESVLLCFIAGANSIFFGERLLTTPNPLPSEDSELLRELGLKPMVKVAHAV
jgi:biotin synthase